MKAGGPCGPPAFLLVGLGARADAFCGSSGPESEPLTPAAKTRANLFKIAVFDLSVSKLSSRFKTEQSVKNERVLKFVMYRFGQAVVKLRIPILVVAVLLLLPAAYGYFHTPVNYDLLTYLPEQIDTMKGQEILKDEFGKGAFSLIVTEGDRKSVV